MNEVRAIVEAFDEAGKRGESCALATVVSVEGSSYRGPGARMSVCEGGTSIGTISAGCLELDVIEHAKQVIQTNVPKLIEYDTSSTSDELAWGLGLGCNGIVQLLVVPLPPDSPYINALRASCNVNAAPVLVATVYHDTAYKSALDAAPIETGARVYLYADGTVACEKLSEPDSVVVERLMRELVVAEMSPATQVRALNNGGVKVFIETLLPPVHLVVFGAGHDALPVIELARGLGWTTEVVDPQARLASVSRFASADRLVLSHPDEVGAQVTVTQRTLTLLMTHNYAQDLQLLQFLLASPARYIGIMGSRKRTERLLSDLTVDEEAHCLNANVSRLHFPVGLDIGSNSPAEIALSVIAEMQAVLEGRSGGMLRNRRGSIHGELPGSQPRSASVEQDASAAVA